jgi:glycosyltransferase involved in cell wall biosynthesis
MNDKILIIGSIPPPIGGVTIHVDRLIKSLKKADYAFDFISFNENTLYRILKSIFKYKTIHLHTSNVYLRFIVSLTGFLTLKKIIITYHGNLGRFSTFKNFFDLTSVILCKIPIVLNIDSLKKALRYNKKAVLISAFIAPVGENELDTDILELTSTIKSNYKTVFSTNAFNVSFDKNGNETYNISALVDTFENIDWHALIVSDPSGKYYKYIADRRDIPRNVFFINKPHSYYKLLEKADVMIRATTTDGDALSVREALILNKIVVASNVVPRPEGVILYDSNSELIDIIHNIDKFNPVEFINEDIVPMIIKIYDSMKN